jgi:hypothetical protein
VRLRRAATPLRGAFSASSSQAKDHLEHTEKESDMVNELRLEGTITDGYQEQPAVRAIESKKHEGVAGYGCQIEFKSSRGRAFINVTHWSADSPMAHARAGDTVIIKGTLIQESWQDASGQWKRKLAIEAEHFQVPRLYTTPSAA